MEYSSKFLEKINHSLVRLGESSALKICQQHVIFMSMEQRIQFHLILLEFHVKRREHEASYLNGEF